ncbi:hypothetical protein BsWGS_20917 [Bradybaena similaris]
MSKKDKKQHKAHEKTVHTDDVGAVDVSTSKVKSGKRKRDSELNTSLDASETYKENIVESKSKKRRKESCSLPENEPTHFPSETVEPQPAKKSKKDKKKKKTPTTLGVVDVDILQQAEVNFQLQADSIASFNSEEPVKKKKHGEKTKRVSFNELVEVTDLPSAKKKHKKLKDQGLMLEEATDSNESKQHSKERKHKNIEVEVGPSDDLVGVNENESEESSKKKKKKHKEKNEKVVSTEKLNKTNEDGSEQPLKKKTKKNKKEGTPAAAPPKKDAATSLKEGQEMDKNEKALQYLKLWQSRRSVWKFNKRWQIHLLNIMYDTALLSDEDFQILLQYLDGLKGKGREKTKEDALQIFSNGEKTEVNAEKEDRARQLCQMLA